MITFEANTADEVWQLIASEFRSGTRAKSQASRGGATAELLHVGLTVYDPQQCWVVSRTPAINPAFAIAELVWIMSGRNDSVFPNFWNRKLPRYAGHGQTYHGAYGFRLRRHFGIDQLQRAYEALQKNPETRQAVLGIWDARADLPDADGQPADPDVPCNVCSLLKVRAGTLEWCQVIRSSDVFLGLPHNFVQFMCLQQTMAGWLGLRAGTYSQLSDSLHVYSDHLADVARSYPVNAPQNSDSLCLAKSESDAGFRELASRMDRMIDASLDECELRELVRPSEWPSVFENMQLVVAADCARRRGWDATVEETISRCGNPAMAFMWQRWAARCAVERRG